MSETRRFSTGAVLSVTTGVLLCDIGQVYEILNFLTDDNLFTHQLPRASRECVPYLLEQFPELAGVDASNVNADNYQNFLAMQTAILGDGFDLEPMADGTHDYRNPVAEAEEMVGKDRVVVLDLTEDSDA